MASRRVSFFRRALDNAFFSWQTTIMEKLYTLDAMRGIAALMVATMHFALINTAYCSPYLAVDFFFALSGFVIAYSYDRKLSTSMTDETFMRRRLIRLYPTFLTGLLLGLAVTVALRAVGISRNDGPYLLQFLTNAVFLPYAAEAPRTTAEAGIAPLNGPYWSLILEIQINLVFAIFFRLLGLRVLGTLVALFAVAIVYTAWREGTLETGYHFHNMQYGIFRIGFSFFAGVLACRLRHRVKTPKVHWGLSLAGVALLLVFPTPESVRWIYDAVCVIVFFPLLILAGATDQPQSAKLRSAFVWIGGASYTLYALHVPMVMVGEAIADAVTQIPYRAWSVAFLTFTVVLAFVFDRYFDVPIRRWLTNRFGDSLPRAPAAATAI